MNKTSQPIADYAMYAAGLFYIIIAALSDTELRTGRLAVYALALLLITVVRVGSNIVHAIKEQS